MGPPWSPPLVSQGLCLAASHAAGGNVALATDMYCTGFPGTGGKSEMKAQGSNLLPGCIQAHLQHNDLRAGLI